MRLVGLLVLAGCACASTPVMGQDAPEPKTAQGDLAVTIYENLALVQDTRRVSLPDGRSRQEFADVSAQIRPETVTLSGEGFGIVEQNFDYDLLGGLNRSSQRFEKGGVTGKVT